MLPNKKVRDKEQKRCASGKCKAREKRADEIRAAALAATYKKAILDADGPSVKGLPSSPPSY